jgi:hypothetical protein
VDNPQAVKAERDMATLACHISGVDHVLIKCRPHSRILVFGDSMAWSWLPAVPGGSDVSMDACPPFLGYLPEHPYPGHLQCRSHNNLVVRLPADYLVIAGRWSSYDDVGRIAPTLDALAGKRVIIIGPTPEMRDLVPRCIRKHVESECAISRTEFDATAKPILAQLRAAAAKHSNVTVLDVTDDFCTATTCPPMLNGVALYWDSHHITATAAKRVDLLAAD